MQDKSTISSESLAVLKTLVGVTVHSLWAPILDAAGAHLAAWTLSMCLSKGEYVNFACEWRETPHYLLDSWRIVVARAIDPLNIQKDASGAYLSPCTISMYAAKPIRRIEIFQFADSCESDSVTEAVEYDGAIRFRCEGGRSFVIGCMLNGPGIATYLHFSEFDGAIDEMLQGGVCRCVLD